MPVECFSCETSAQSRTLGGETSNFMAGSAPRQADIVVVVQQSSCVEKFDFKTMLHLIETSLHDINMTHNLYSVVGYGGPGELARPHSYTSGGRLFSTYDSVQFTIQRLNTDGSGGDIYDAMRFAAGLTWRAGVGKGMLVVSCDVSTSGWFYGDAITMLRNNMISMHYINPLQLKLKTKKMKPAIFGYNKSSVFTVKNLNSQTGDTSLRNQLRIPKELIAFSTVDVVIVISCFRTSCRPWPRSQEVQCSLTRVLHGQAERARWRPLCLAES